VWFLVENPLPEITRRRSITLTRPECMRFIVGITADFYSDDLKAPVLSGAFCLVAASRMSALGHKQT
jgi:hypothetical protein